MIGGSYGGQIQYAVAMQDKRVDALIPIITWNDLAYSLAPNNTDFTGRSHVLDPGSRQEAVGRPVLRRRHRGWPRRPAGRPDAQRRLPQLRRRGLPDGAEAQHPRLPGRRDDGDRDPVVRRAVPRTGSRRPPCWSRARRTPCSTCRRRSPRSRASALAAREARMVWQSWGHSGSKPAPGELDFGADVTQRLVPGPPVPELDGPVRARRHSRRARPGVLVLPRLGALRHLGQGGRHRGGAGVRRAQHVLPDRPTDTAVPDRLRRPDGATRRRDGRQRVVRERTRRRRRRTRRPRRVEGSHGQPAGPRRPRAPSPPSPARRSPRASPSSAHRA